MLEFKNVKDFRDTIVSRLNSIDSNSSKDRFESSDVIKANNVKFYGIIDHGSEEESTVFAPCAYVNEIYGGFCNGGESNTDIEDSEFDKIVKDMYDNLSSHRVDKELSNSTYINDKNNSFEDSPLGFITNWEETKPYIRFRLLNKERNKEYLKDCPHVPFLDLEIAFFIVLPDDVVKQIYDKQDVNDAICTIRLNNSIFDKWKITIEELKEAAYESTYDQEEIFCKDFINTLGSLIASKSNTSFFPLDFDATEAGFPPYTYILSNKAKNHGAGVMLYRDVLKDLCDKHNVKRYIILPSSIHEVILVPAPDDEDDTECLENFCNIVREVNSTSVAPEEFLSDSVYIYDRQSNKYEKYDL